MAFDQIYIYLFYNVGESEVQRMNKEKLKDYVKRFAIENFGNTEEEIDEAFKDVTGIAYYIAKVAHYNQKRVNGVTYFAHPLSVYRKYRFLIGIEEDNFDPYELMGEYGIPFWGVQEVCLLHDVLEDTDVTLDEIEEMYEELGQHIYFEAYIKDPLILITHDKSEDYETYMKNVLCSSTSALVKLLDLTDNTNIFGLDKYEDEEDERMHRYIKYEKMVNDKYHFIERIAKYRKDCAL